MSRHVLAEVAGPCRRRSPSQALPLHLRHRQNAHGEAGNGGEANVVEGAKTPGGGLLESHRRGPSTLTTHHHGYDSPHRDPTWALHTPSLCALDPSGWEEYSTLNTAFWRLKCPNRRRFRNLRPKSEAALALCRSRGFPGDTSSAVSDVPP